MMEGRIRWAVDGLGLTGRERVLEVGPGHGVAIDLCARRLESGRVVGLDRSAKMITASARRNSGHIEAGRVELVEGRPDTALTEIAALGPFDRILAIRVREFVDEPDRTLAPLLPLLAPGAQVHLLFDSPGGSNLEEVAARMEGAMLERGLVSTRSDLESGAEFNAVRVVGLAGVQK